MSKKMRGYYPEINVKTLNIDKYNINDIDNLKEVKTRIIDFYRDGYISNENISKPITNIDTGMNVEIWASGINETFGNANYYKNLSKKDKKIKLATMDNLAKMIKYGEIRTSEASNYHNSNSPAKYYYLQHPIIIDGVNYMVNMDIRKVPNINGRFYIHSIDTKKVETPGNSKSRPLTVSTDMDNIPQSNNNVKPGTLPKYSMQENINDTDSSGRKLSKQQQEYFKNSEIRDENGKLNIMYHGSSKNFTVFDNKKSNYNNLIFFSESPSFSLEYSLGTRGKYDTEGEYYINGKKLDYDWEKNLIKPKNEYLDKTDWDIYIYPVYLNVEKLFDGFKNETEKLNFENYLKEKYGMTGYELENFVESVNSKNEFDAKEDEKFVSWAYDNGYDGIAVYETDDNNQRNIAVFNSNQIKSINNLNPSKNEDIRFSKNNKLWQQYLDNYYKNDGTKTYFKDIRKSNIGDNILPKASQNTVIQNEQQSINNKKKLNPNEISKLTLEEANTTPKLSTVKRNSKNDGESHFFNNIHDKTNMLNENQKSKILSEKEVQYYDKITNKETLETAHKRLQDNGAKETQTWFGKSSENANAIDVTEGWILLKQYADNNDSDGMVAVAKKLRDIGTKAGQTVQAFNIMERMTPEGMVKYAQTELSEAYDKMIKGKTKKWIEQHRADFDLHADEVQFIMDTMKDISKMNDGYEKKVKLAQIQKLMTDKLPPAKGAGIKSWMRISMLFNPKTQIRNVAGNAVIAPVNYFGDLFSSYADKLVSKKTNVRTTGNVNIKAIIDGMKRGAYEATNDYKLGINTKNMEGNRFEIGEGKSFNEKSMIGKSLNRVDSLLGYMLDAGDRVFSESSFENSLQNQMILNNTTEVTQDMIDIARTESLQRTWNDSNGYTKFVLDVRRGLNRINIKGYGLGDVLIPFAKTPANLTKAIVDYSPVGLVNTIIQGKNLKNAIDTGQFTPQMQHKFVQTLGKATAGSMLYILGYALAKAGITSGESDDDKDTANFLKNTLGTNSYSIKIGGKSFAYDWAQPLAAPLSITANYVSKSKKNPEASKLENLISSLDVAGNILLEQSFMESISTVLNNNDGVATGLQEAILELPSRAVPTFVKQIADMTDGTQRQTFNYDKPLETMKNKVLAKLPGLNKTLAPSVDTMGREIQKYGGKNNLFNVFLNPANVNTENISKSAKEIYKIYKSTGDKTIMPKVAPYYINQKNEKVILSPEQKANYQKISGKIIEKEVQDLLNNEKYKKLDDSDKATIIKSIVDYSYNKAREEVLDISMPNTYNKAVEYISKGGKISDYYLKKEEINFSLENPRKYNTIKAFNIDYDNYTKYMKRINELKDSNNFTDNRKNAIFNYINSLNISKNSKIALYFMSNYSISNYKNDMFKYINSLNLSKSEKEEIYYYLYPKKGK